MNFFISLIGRVLGVKTDFHRLFFRNELRALLGRRNEGLLLLGIIFLLTWLALGYALGSLDALRQRMDNPYTNWVDWQVPYGREMQENRRQFDLYMQDSTVRDSYFLVSINNYSREARAFRHQSTQAQYNMNCRTLEPDDELYKRILDVQTGNVRAGTAYDEKDDHWDIPPCGLIVKAEMLEQLGYENPDAQKMIPVDYNDQTVYLPIVAVVRELPSLCDYICTPRLFNLLVSDNFLVLPDGATNHLRLLTLEGDAAVVEQNLRRILVGHSLRKLAQEPLVISDTDVRYIYRLGFHASYPPEVMDSLVKVIRRDWGQPGQPERYFEYNCDNAKDDNLDNPYYVAFNFSELGRVRAFKNLLYERFKIELSMDQIEAKENFWRVSWLTYLISLVLFGFSIISIILFINNKLSNHLEQNKPNLGTFKAFGMSNQQLTQLYARIILAFLLAGFGLAAAAAALFALVNAAMPFSIITLFHWNIGLAFALLFVTCLLVSIRTINVILKDTPGNLIYGR